LSQINSAGHFRRRDRAGPGSRRGAAAALARSHFRGDGILWLTQGSGAVLCLMGAGLLVETVMSG
tara:strand:+ start:13700 stop:13894 length:195 start_codon:yes stop_codon:yes gene_type:complete